MHKKGQVTFFIVLGFFILFSIIFVTLVTPSLKEESAYTPTDKITEYIEQCIQRTMIDAVRVTATQGGFYQLPPHHVQLWDNDVPFFYGPRSVSFSRSQWEQELAHYLEDQLNGCTQSFWFFAVQGITILEEEKRANVMIRPDTILVTLSYPLTIMTMGRTKQLDQFIAVIPLQLIPLSTALETWNKQEKNGELCISCLYELGQEHGLFVRVYPSDRRQLFYEFIDMNTVIDKNYLVFSFAEEY